MQQGRYFLMRYGCELGIFELEFEPLIAWARF